MFYGCSSLYSLNLSTFNTSQVWEMNYMFGSCIKIISLNLTNFCTRHLYMIDAMFYNCSSLINLDLSNFDFFNQKFKYIENDLIFGHCNKLEYINLENVRIYKYYIDYYYNYKMFKETSDILIICSKYNEWNNYLKGVKLKVYCFKNLNSNHSMEFECYAKNNSLNYHNNKHICSSCGKDYYQFLKDKFSNESYINCYSAQEGYYLDKEDNYYKKCYSTCKKCEKGGNEEYHNCIECNENNTLELNISNYLNCYNICQYYHYFDTILNKK